jgi:aspartokinase-like uncharacterized kinase
MSVACVVKLGGSQAFAPGLRRWLRAIAGAAGEVVVVPGGGPFAGAVRAAQLEMGFDDHAAHRMALHAMVQFGIALASIGHFVLAETEPGIASALAAGQIPVWSPLAMLREAPEVPESWAATSDSLALWLATALAARSVLLVKPRAAPPGATIGALVKEELLDRAFPDFLGRYTGAVFLAGPDDVPAAIDPRRPPGTPLRALA